MSGAALHAFLTPSRHQIIAQAERVEIFRLDPYLEKGRGFGGYSVLKEGGKLPPELASRARAIVLEPASYVDPCAGGECLIDLKLCGGFEPRHGLRFWARGPAGSWRYADVLVCLTCGDLGVVRPGDRPGFQRLRAVLVASLSERAEKQLHDLVAEVPQLEDGVQESVPVWLQNPEIPEPPPPDPSRPPALERHEAPIAPPRTLR